MGLFHGRLHVTELFSNFAFNKGTSQESRCQFLPGKDDQVVVRDFRDHTLAKIRDIEDLANLGKKMGVCPYYASRPTIKPSEVCLLLVTSLCNFI